jgi:hypothetical protein
MKNLIKIITIFILIFSILWIIDVNAWIDWLNSVQWIDNIKNHSLTNIAASWDISNDIENVWFSILTLIKYILSWLLVIYIVYTWIQMILSMWNDEDKLSTSKKQLRYTLIWLVFINIPWTIYNSFKSNEWSIDGNINWTWSSQIAQQNENIFINTDLFNQTLNWWIIMFIETAIFSVAVFMIILSGIKIILSRWKDEDMTESKNKIVWSIVWLVFIWFIESWQTFVYKGNIKDGANLFQTIEELALFFAWPVAIFFLTLAWYYYITSNGDEEKVKKAKSIIINTVIATVILLASYAFLKDLTSLSI